MTGRPNWKELQCPKCKQYGTFKKTYARHENRYKSIGRQCIDDFDNNNVFSYQERKKGCGHFVKTKRS